MTTTEGDLSGTSLRAILGISLVLCLVSNLILYGVILISGDRNKYEPVETLGEVQAKYGPNVKNYFADILDEEGIASMQQGEDQLLALLAWVGNSIPSNEPHSSFNPIEVFEGGAAICGGMAAVYSAAAQSLGYRTREVQLLVSMSNRMDTHITVEVFLNGQWRVFDPTFNITFASTTEPDELLGVEKIQEALFYNTGTTVEPVLHGRVAYPVTLGDYYGRWQPLFNNVYVHARRFDVGETVLRRLLRKLPLTGWVLKDKSYYLSPDGRVWRAGFTHNVVFLLGYLVLPTISLLLVVGLALSEIMHRRAVPVPD